MTTIWLRLISIFITRRSGAKMLHSQGINSSTKEHSAALQTVMRQEWMVWIRLLNKLCELTVQLPTESSGSHSVTGIQTPFSIDSNEFEAPTIKPALVLSSLPPSSLHPSQAINITTRTWASERRWRGHEGERRDGLGGTKRRESNGRDGRNGEKEKVNLMREHLWSHRERDRKKGRKRP